MKAKREADSLWHSEDTEFLNALERKWKWQRCRKHLICIGAVAAVIAVVLAASLWAVHALQKPTRLSEMTEEECLLFLEKHGVTIPTNDRAFWGWLAKDTIELVEQDPDWRAPYIAMGLQGWGPVDNGTMQDFFDAIREVVNEYYGLG